MAENGSIDWETLRSLVEEQVKAGVQGIVPTGTTGESPTLNNEEHLQVIKAVVEAAAGRVPVIAGTGANSTAEALQLTREADRLGADAFLQVAPYYNKPSQEGVYQHFKAIAEATGKPIILYSIPGRCGIEIEAKTVSRLASASPNIQAIKEAGGQVEKVRELKAACPEVTVLSGDDGLIIPFVEAGAEGVVSVASNLSPQIISQLVEACLAGKKDDAERISREWEMLLTELVFLEGNPVTIKEALYLAGHIPSPAMRLPLVRMPEPSREVIQNHLASLNLIRS